MKNRFLWIISITLLFGLFITGCKKEELVPGPIEEIPEADEVHKFVWEGLATYYYWVDDVSNLIDPAFENEDSLNAFLNTYDNPEDLFYDLLYEYGNIDRWSFIVDNSQEIDNWLTGISESMGFDFMLSYISENSNNVFGYVRYVLEDSPADQAGIKRGDLFLTVNGTQLTASNYRELLFTQKTYTLGMARYENKVFSVNGTEHTMTAVELQEDPIYLDTTYIINGMNVGYLVYNGFTSAYDKNWENSYDILLNNTIAKFKGQGIDKLILDLRYNGGGSVQTSMYLASMIFGTNTELIFAKYKYNDLLYQYFRDKYGSDYFNYYFSSRIPRKSWDLEDAEGNFIRTVETPSTPITSLNLSELIVITSSSTASASELLINGLEPYMNVVQIGTNTTGKNVGSFTIRDWIDDETVNPNHSWAMQPITLKIANSVNYSDYSDGLPPDLEGREGVLSLKPLGDTDETLLKIALDYLKGGQSKSADFESIPHFKPLKSAKDISIFNKEMYIEPEIVALKDIRGFSINKR